MGEYETKGQFAPRRTPPSMCRNQQENFDQLFHTCPIICEILDSRTLKTIQANSSVERTSEFIQSNTLVSQALAMVSENREVAGILKDFLGPGGTDLSLEDSSIFIKDDECASFMAVATDAQKNGKIVLGYVEGPKCVLNPNDKFTSRCWAGVQWVTLVKLHNQRSQSIAAIGSGMPAQSSKAGPKMDTAEQFRSMSDRMERIQTKVHRMAHVLTAFAAEKATNARVAL